MAVARDDRHPVALAHALGAQAVGQAVDQGIELGIGPGGLAADNRDALCVAMGGAWSIM